MSADGQSMPIVRGLSLPDGESVRLPDAEIGLGAIRHEHSCQQRHPGRRQVGDTDDVGRARFPVDAPAHVSLVDCGHGSREAATGDTASPRRAAGATRFGFNKLFGRITTLEAR
jgi:hypothetical protein